MIIQLSPDISRDHQAEIVGKVNSLDYKTNLVRTQKGVYIVCIAQVDMCPVDLPLSRHQLVVIRHAVDVGNAGEVAQLADIKILPRLQVERDRGR